MPEIFKCPSCSAPLEFSGKALQKCAFCGSSIVAPSPASFQIPASSFGDLSALTGKALKIAEIQRLIQSGNKIYAIKLFRETFGVGLKEAKDAVEAMERGESVDISGMQVRSSAHSQASAQNFNAQTPFAVKRKGASRGGSILAAVVGAAVLILGAFGAVFYFAFGSINENLRETPDGFSVSPRDSAASAADAQEILRLGGAGTGAGKFNDNRVVAVDANGRIYSGDYQGGKIQVFDAGGKYLTQWTADAKMILYDMAADRKGNVYIAQNKGVFLYEGESGKLLQKAENIHPRGLAVALDGNVVVTNGREITVFDANLKPVRQFKDAAEKANSTFGFAKIAVDGNGVIYAIDRQNDDICKFSADGKFLNRFPSHAGSPNSVALDNKGRIFVADTSEIFAMDENGRLIRSFDAAQAFGLALNDAGELFVASRPFVVKYKINF